MIRTGISSSFDRGWFIATCVFVALAVVAVWVVPADAMQGDIQKLMYVHVPSAWSAFLCFLAVLVASAWFLRSRSRRAWLVAGTAMGTGVVLITVTLITGSIWGSVTWGTFWAWDARITSTAAMGLIYAGVLAVRMLVTTPRGQTVAAALGIAAFVMVPVVHFSVIWFRTLHQPATVLAPSVNPPIDARMLLTLACAAVAASMLTASFVRRRIARKEDVEGTRAAVAQSVDRAGVAS